MGVMGRTDYTVDGRSRCTLFLTASKMDSREGRPFCARTEDGGLSWQFLSFIGDGARRLCDHALFGEALVTRSHNNHPTS